MNKKGMPQNLTPLKKGDPRTIELAKKGAAVSNPRRRIRKDLRESANMVLGLALKKGVLAEFDDINSIAESQGKNISVADAINITMAQRALMGDVQAAIFIRDMAGQKPSDKVEIDQSMTIEAWAKSNKVKL